MSINRKVRDTARAENMAAMYRQGVTLQKIGDQFEASRERVRQILRTVGIDASAPKSWQRELSPMSKAAA